MIGALYSGLTGLKTHQTKVNIIGNNLANINTIGFKKSRVLFREAFAMMLKGGVSATGERGGTNPNQVGAGVQLSSIDVNHKNGSPQITDAATDLMIRGKGMFVLGAPDAANVDPNARGSSASASSIKVFTRAGNFGIDTSGDLVYRPNGYRVMGWSPNSSTGEIDTKGPVGNINFPFAKSIAKKTSMVEYSGNLDTRAGSAELKNAGGTGVLNAFNVPQGSSLAGGAHKLIVSQNLDGTFQASLDGGAGVPIQAGQVVAFADADGTPVLEATFGADIAAGVATLNAVSPEYTTTIGVYDGVGQQHVVKFKFTKDMTPDTKNIWNWQAVDATLATLTTGAANGGSLQFNAQSGTLVTATPAKTEVSITPVGDGAPLVFDVNFTDLTQFASSSDAIASKQDGVGAGSLTSFSIGPDGLINGIFSNGISRPIGQTAIADIPNPEGLTTIQDTMFAVSPSSGTPTYVTAGGRNMGEISSGALEMSNVDLTEEFTDLITTERGFQASSRVITTSDTILQEALGLKR